MIVVVVRRTWEYVTLPLFVSEKRKECEREKEMEKERAIERRDRETERGRLQYLVIPRKKRSCLFRSMDCTIHIFYKSATKNKDQMKVKNYNFW